MLISFSAYGFGTNDCVMDLQVYQKNILCEGGKDNTSAEIAHCCFAGASGGGFAFRSSKAL
jgi:hypothetical protein